MDRVGRMVGALRDAVGPDIDIMVDCHARPSPRMGHLFAAALDFAIRHAQVCAEIKQVGYVPDAGHGQLIGFCHADAAMRAAKIVRSGATPRHTRRSASAGGLSKLSSVPSDIQPLGSPVDVLEKSP